MPPIAVSRRALLAAVAGAGVGGAVGGIAGCATPSDSTAQPARTFGDDDVDLARRTAQEAAELAVVVGATARRHRDLGFLEPLRARHLEHVRAFAPDGKAGRNPNLDQVPRSATDALRALVAAEQRATASTRRGAMSASSGDLASALASAAACLGQHQRLLADALAARPDGG